MTQVQASKKIMTCLIVSLILTTSLFILQNNASAQMYLKSYPVRGSDVIYSQNIPFSGDFSINMEYSTIIETHVPDSVIAGKSFEIIVNPTAGVLTSAFQNGEKLEQIKVPLLLGVEKTLDIPETMIGEVFVLPKMTIIPKVIGPGHVVPESLSFDSESIGKFHIFTDEDIGIHDSITVELESIINLENSGIINLSLAKIPLGNQISDITTEPKIAISIPLKKFIQTQIHLQVTDGEKPESFKVKPSLMDEKDQIIQLPSHSIEIYLNGIPKLKVAPNHWSEDFFVEPGSYNIQARIAETRDTDNAAITYSTSESTVQTITIKPHIQNQTESMEIMCPPGQVFENNQCIEAESQEGFFGIGGGGCLIATATYGSEMAPQVQILREIRDNTVMNTVSGSSFMIGFNQIYYLFSPTIADIERENSSFREMIKILILPMLTTISILQFADNSSEIDVIMFGSIVIGLNIGMYIAGPIFVIKKTYKYQHRKHKSYREKSTGNLEIF